jgi:signal transduction histidine kinase
MNSPVQSHLDYHSKAMFSSIRVRLTLSHLAVIVLAMGLSGFLLFSFLQRYFLETMEDSLIAQARITAQALIPGAIIDGPPVEVQAPAYNTVQQRVGNLSLQTQNLAPPPAGKLALDWGDLSDVSFQISTELDTRIRLLDTQGIVQVDSQPEGQGENLQSDPLVVQALAGQYVSRVDEGDLSRTAAMYVLLPVQVEDKVAAVVYVSQSLNDVTTVLRDLRSRLLLSAVIALILSAVLGLLLSQAIARPVGRLTAAAWAVAQGNLDQQVPVKSRDELGRLSRAFNEMTTRLRAARQMQIDIVANVSHELRTPLTSIKGLVETLRGGAVDDSEVRDDFLETVENETDRLIRLINDLLLLSRLDSEALNLKREPLDIGQLTRAMIEQLTPQAEVRRVALQVEAKPTAPPAWGDPDRLEQVLLNLLDNAIKYSRPGGHIIINVDGGERSSVQVQVRDEGIGIPAEDLAHIGERFYRADKARSRGEGGSGLGLAIARSLVEVHGGRLWVESEEGRGTVVTFTLPTP